MSRKLIDVLISLMKEFPNPTQHNLRGHNDTQSTIDYHQLDLLRDDGMDEQEID
jgi:hypothetical protein